MKFDLMDYLATVPSAPVHSLREILDSGLYDAALESGFRARDTMQTRDSEAYRKALATRAVLRERLLSMLDSLRLDALVYPTIRQRPALIGEPQVGSNCQLSAQTGLPSISLPAGFSMGGLPIGVELLGRPFADARIVSLAYAFEQSGSRRRPPPSTPALGAGSPAAAFTLDVSATAPPAVARATFTFGPLSGELGWVVRITGVAADRIRLTALERVDSAGRLRIIQRLSGPGRTGGAGRLVLEGINRRALLDGQLRLAMFTTDRDSKARDGSLSVPVEVRKRVEE
jgi:hypothetical protein